MEKIILITGASSGIGRAAATTLQARGWRVWASARNLADVEALREAGFEALTLDVADSASIAQATATLLQATGGRLDAVFSNAGYGQPGAVEDLPREAIRLQFETNVFGAIELINRLLPTLRQAPRGRIVFNSSLLGYAAMRMRGAYNASKYALEGFADTLRLELAGSDIDVCLLEPGPITSNFRANCLPHFYRWIDREHSVHRAAYARVEARLLSSGPVAPGTLPADAVVEALIHALEARCPKARYRITRPAKALALAKRLLPTRWLDRLLLAAGKLDGPQTPPLKS